MITKWEYTWNRAGYRNDVKKFIKEKGYKTLDLGASANYWSYPEVKHSADCTPIGQHREGDPVEITENTHYIVDFDNIHNSTLANERFDFTICSHTLEDIYKPFELLDFIEKISPRGLIAIPSKFNEFKYLYNNKYRGNPHHKCIFDIIDNQLIYFPKYSFIEVRDEPNVIRDIEAGDDLYFYWEGKIPRKYWGQGENIEGDKYLISKYFQDLSISK